MAGPASCVFQDCPWKDKRRRVAPRQETRLIGPGVMARSVPAIAALSSSVSLSVRLENVMSPVLDRLAVAFVLSSSCASFAGDADCQRFGCGLHTLVISYPANVGLPSLLLGRGWMVC